MGTFLAFDCYGVGVKTQLSEVATGAWCPRRSKALVARNRSALAKLESSGVRVRFRHVRAHTGHGMNERADALAKQGAQGLRVRDGKVFTPTSVPPPPSSSLPTSTVCSVYRQWATVPD